ncbi:MAG TPA: energy transducer TonB, partial [Myxococcaceae bacterium]|nr:energy transducer TonB [Myxococcaceae bacterium]
GYTIEVDGRVDEIELDDPSASPLLFSAAKDWLEQCRSSQQRVRPMRISELLSFPPPDLPPVNETPVPLDEHSAVSRPQRGPHCTPDKPPAAVPGKGTLSVEYVVQSNGRVGETVLKGGDAPKALLKTVKAWLKSCPYTPAMRDGQPVAVRLSETFTF